MCRRRWPERATPLARVRCIVRPEPDPVEEPAKNEETPPAGPELAQAVLEAARARRAERPASRRAAVGGRSEGGRRLRGYSGPGPDPRDPQPLGVVLAKL